MIKSLDLWRAPSGDWVVMINGQTEWPVGWWSADYETEEKKYASLKLRIENALKSTQGEST